MSEQDRGTIEWQFAESMASGIAPITMSEFIDELWETASGIDKLEQQVDRQQTEECLFDKLSEDDKCKPLLLCCPCRKCSPYF